MATRRTDRLTAGNGSRHLGAAAREVAEHARALTRLEVELASLELKQKVTSFGLGIALAVAAGLLALFGLAFAFATAAAALALVVAWWVALLIVTGVLFLAAGVAGALAVGRFRRAAPPVPQQAIDEARRTTEAIKH